MKNLSYKNNKKGFTILFAVLVASVILAVVISIMNIALKQVLFSGIGRESQFAYYAADSGVECALFWDFRSFSLLGGKDLFATSSFSLMVTNPLSVVGDGLTTTCGRTSIYNNGNFEVDSTGSEALTTFRYPISMPTGVGDDRTFCVIVRVHKVFVSSLGRIVTTINSSGYNDDCSLDAPAIFERGLEVTY